MHRIKKVTIKDVAREANVSISVVSYVLNNSTKKTISEATKERVIRAAKQLNYVPNRIASGMRTRKSLAIGVVSYWEIEGTTFMHILSGINKVASENGYSVVFCNAKSGEDSFSYLDYYLDRTIDGIIFIAPHQALGSIDESAHIRNMKKAGVPFVIINGHSEESDINYINIDFYGSTHLITTHLIKQGYEQITYVAPFHLDYIELKQRYLGYKDAMAQNNLQEDVCDVEDVAEHIKSFKAVVTNKSDTAHAVMTEAIKQDIRIPDDFVMIAGNTEAYSEFLFPPLSTVLIPGKEMGELAAATLLKRMNGSTEASNIKLECSLQLRKSC